MDDSQLLRYSRQIHVDGVDIDGQQRLLASRVLIIGVGGLGSPVATYLAAAGVGHLVLSDHDRVDLSNLQRQIVHSTADIGRPKVESARDRLHALNPEIEISCIGHKLEGEALVAEVRRADVVVDATDNFTARFTLNAACVAESTPLVSGAAIRTEGQVAVFAGHLPEAPCYRCLYRDENELGERCAETGVLAPVPGIIGTLQATETLKLLLGLGEPLLGRLLLLDARSMEWRSLKLRKDPACPVCSN